LNQGSNIMANMFWTWSKLNLKKLEKRFQNLCNFLSHFFWKSYESNGFRVFVSFETCNISTISYYNLSINVMVVLKTLDNNQWPWDWFITQAMNIRFKVKVTTFATTHIWAFKPLCYKW
jgi:hypothetical protein